MQHLQGGYSSLCARHGSGTNSSQQNRQNLTYQRHERSGITPTRSNVDRILALRVLTKRLHHFRTGLLVVSVNLREAFDSMNRDVFRSNLTLRGKPSKFGNLIHRLHSGKDSAMRCDGIISDYFPVMVPQEYLLPFPTLQYVHGQCTVEDVGNVVLRSVDQYSEDH